MNCTSCNQDKAASDFDSGRRRCKRCRLDDKKRRYDPERQKAVNARASWKVRAARYGTSEEELKAQWEAQEYHCAICNRYERMEHPHVDHCHATGRVRGLLCASCNRILGLAQDDPLRLEQAAAYLRRHRITHGRHCTCRSCAHEDWTNPDLASCGMHGAGCPAVYQPWGPAGSYPGVTCR